MAINQVSEIIGEVLVRNNRTTTDAFVTDAMLQDWTRDAHTWAASRYKWPFTEARVSSTYVEDSADDGRDFPEGWKADSIRFLQVGGKRFTKLNFQNYLKFREDFSSDSKKVFSDFGRLYYVNPNADVSGTITFWGQYQPTIDPTAPTATTIFSTFDEEGNEAIVEKMSSYLKRREHLIQEAELHDQRATSKLDEIWKRIQDEQHAYQNVEDEGIFKRIDILSGVQRDELFRRDQFF
jgi:hypothetical protein